MTAPAYGELRRVSETASVLLENNPSMMTLEGTNSWVLRAPDAPAAVVVDPGYRDLEHLELLAAVGPVELIVLTHHHPDHAEGAPWLAEKVGAPVRAFDASLCLGAEPFADGDVLTAGGLSFEVLHTPGHTDDSVSLHVAGQILTGDTILGRGTTVLHDLGDYLRSLRRLIELPGGTPACPGTAPSWPICPRPRASTCRTGNSGWTRCVPPWGCSARTRLRARWSRSSTPTSTRHCGRLPS